MYIKHYFIGRPLLRFKTPQKSKRGSMIPNIIAMVPAIIFNFTSLFEGTAGRSLSSPPHPSGLEAKGHPY